MAARFATVAAFAASATAFMPAATPGLSSMATRPAVTSLHMSGPRFNKKIDLDSPKVATQVLKPKPETMSCACFSPMRIIRAAYNMPEQCRSHIAIPSAIRAHK